MSAGFLKRWVGLAVLGVALGAATCAHANATADADPGQLKDQFGAPGGLYLHAGQVQVAIVVTAKRLRRLKPWERALKEAYRELPVVRVADVPRSAPTEYEAVAAKLRKRLPEDVAVLVDLEGVWGERFGLDVSVPNLLIFDREGRLTARHAGMFKQQLFEALRVDLDAVLAQMP